ncbi:hypothetical protein F511_32220 [Dorcoceras hygrometricum]|uniref:Uncharacterized protein n=1 Tax=Dorcoceras hygrometricum TaxID=472368 RepID=A0A2Z7CRU7_9LAMI|nr:hypothetical protein F511_32220 [Dorcoceras hygrometricum]
MRAMDLARAIDEELFGYTGFYRSKAPMGEGGGYNRGRYNMGPITRPEVLGYDRGRAGPTTNRAAQQEKQGGGPMYRTSSSGHAENNKPNPMS